LPQRSAAFGPTVAPISANPAPLSGSVSRSSTAKSGASPPLQSSEEASGTTRETFSVDVTPVFVSR
jgi:hypothetical protein